jgi:signal transduction histidine kinase
VNAPATRLPPVTELHLFRIMQEAVTNIEKHAQAKVVKLQMKSEGDWMVFKIQDDGCGFDTKNSRARKAKGHGLGLTNMRERALSLDGTYELKSVPGKGTTVTVRVPVIDPKRISNAKRGHLILNPVSE